MMVSNVGKLETGSQTERQTHPAETANARTIKAIQPPMNETALKTNPIVF